MKFTVTINGDPITLPDGTVREWDDYPTAEVSWNVTENKYEKVRIICHDLDEDFYQPYFTAFLKAHPEGTKGFIHFNKWINGKHREFQDIYVKSNSDYHTRFLSWLNGGIDNQQKLF